MRIQIIKASAFAVLLTLGHSSYAEPPIKALDARGCTLQVTNGSTVLVRPTLNFVNISYDEPNFISKDHLLRMARAALKAGCPVNDFVDESGLSHLNAAILFNRADLVQLLLEHGADPTLRIASPGRSLDGMDSYALLDKLMKSQGKDRSAVKRLLEARRG